MKINSISNQSFGKLKITTDDDAEAKNARKAYACSTPFERWEKIDKLSGKTRVEIRFYSAYEAPRMSCVIGKETFMRPENIYGPADFQKKLDLIEKELHQKCNIETAQKYFA